MSTLITNLNDLIEYAANNYIGSNVETFKSDVPGPQGLPGTAGLQGLPGPQGDKGEDLVLEQIIYNGNGVFEWHFSDESVYTTPSLMGPQGATGAQGLKGDQGISVHHLKPTSTTNVHGDFRIAGEDDTYTFYGDDEETINLGFFVVHNGEDGQDAYEVALDRGYVGTSEQFYSDITYNAINISVIEGYASAANSSRSAAEAARDIAVGARDEAVLAKDTLLAQKGQVNGIASLDASGKVPSSQLPSYVDDVIEVATKAALPVTGESGKLYIVVADEISGGNTSTYRWTGTVYAMVSDSLTAVDVKNLYESNADTNVYTDDEKALVDVGTALVTTNKTLPSAINQVHAALNTHRTSTGEEHSFIDQDVTSTGTPRFNSVQLNGGTGTQGLMSWNAGEETVDLVSNGAVIQLGQEFVVSVRNKTASVIADGTPLMYAGTLGNSSRLLVEPMDGTNKANMMRFLGVATTEILAGDDGKVTMFGKVRGINTNGSAYGEVWQDGDILYVSPTVVGALTRFEPTNGQLDMPIAGVIKAHSSGSVYVRALPIDRNANNQASDIHVNPAGNLGSTSVQLALEELQVDLDGLLVVTEW